MSEKYDVIVLGGGPAGYVAAIRCAQLGLKTACIEQWINKQGKPALGGTCLNVGCIPSKALLESSQIYADAAKGLSSHGIEISGVRADVPTMISGKDKIVQELTGGIEHLFRANKIHWIQGSGSLLPERQIEVTDIDSGKSRFQADNIILATGSRPIEISAVPLHSDRIVDSAGALDWESVPQKLCVIGAGVIGLELGSVWRRLGSEVVVLEAQDTFLPMVDRQIAKDALRQFGRQGLDIKLGARVMASTVNEGVALEYTDKNGEQQLQVDRVIVAVGRRPNIDQLTLPEADLLIDERGLVHVNDNCETNIPGIWAIGDLVRGPMLAHKGSEEGVAVAERIAGKHCHLNYDAIPSVIYTHPEISWVGKTEEQLKEEGRAYKSGVFPFAASGRAKAMRDTGGMVKILADEASDELLGMHIIGGHSSELIGHGVMAIEFQGTSEDIARSVFAHPTLSEAIHEAALAADGRAIHIPNKKRS
ncbi:dihydrolipoyl dehydrogenase [Chromatiales bacterium (ex Bugula neritina AB1)]|nr:dihydrolipoyl dehydrogenase [Chromatiales bacterium (ex Bugula neritina AB1)]